jgi:hypothetical protein
MSRLQDAVNKFAREWQAEYGEKPSQDALLDGTFCKVTGQSFCLCLKLGTGLGSMINLAGLTCRGSGKPVTAESYEWMDEARAERQASR